MRLIFYILFVLLCVHNNVSCQNPKPVKTNLPANVSPVKNTKQQAIPRNNKIETVSAVVNGNVLIRWVPGSPALMQQGIKYGYKIERISLMEDKNLSDAVFSGAEIINSSPVKSLNSEDTLWKHYNKRNKNVAFVYKYLYSQNNGKALSNDVLFGFALKSCEYDFELAKISGLGCVDSSVKGNFAYRISLMNTDPGFKYEPGTVLVNSMENTKFLFDEPLKAKSSAKHVTLTWGITGQRKLYGAYNVERSEDGSVFVRINKSPVVFVRTHFEKDKREITYIDTIKISGKKFYYRVKGLSFFAFEGSPSEVVTAACKASLDGYPFIDSIGVIENKFSAIYFHHSPEVNGSEVKKIICFRSIKEQGPYSVIMAKLNQKDKFTLIDEAPHPVNYYKIAYDLDDGDTIWSPAAFIKIPDVIPPAAPVGLTGKIDSSGTVTLSWQNNADRDLHGYRVFSSNSLTEEFVEVSKKIIKSNSFTAKIALNNLTEEIYYKITAVDLVYNNSAYSQVIKLKKPDRIAPVAAVITRLTHSDSTIDLEIIASPSKDILKHIVIRINVNTKSSDTVMVTGSGEPKLKMSDKSAEPGNTYQYEIKAVDDDGNSSVVKSGHLVYQPKYFSPVKEIRAIVDREKRQVVLEWNYPSREVYSFLIYKSKKGEAFKLIETVSPSLHRFIDKEVNVNNIYEYKLKAVLKSGSETKLSVPVEVIY